MLLFECDNPKCCKKLRVRHGYAFLPDQHFIMGAHKGGRWVSLGETDPTYPVHEVDRPRHQRLVTVQSRLPEGWLWGFHPTDVTRSDLLAFCSSECLVEVIPTVDDSGETPDERRVRVLQALEARGG